MKYGNGFFYLAEIGDFRLAQNGCFHPALTTIFHPIFELIPKSPYILYVTYNQNLIGQFFDIFMEGSIGTENICGVLL